MIAVMPMAGRGSRFSGSEYNRPKPLISVDGVPMFIRALASLDGIEFSRLIIIALKEHEEKYGIRNQVKEHLAYPVDFVFLDDVTEGQLCTINAARQWIDTPEDILIVSSDTIIVSDLNKTIAHRSDDCKGIISVIDIPGEQWSFAKTNDEGRVIEVAEKVKISNHASTGLYYFSSGAEFCFFTDEILQKKEKTRGEYYVMPLYTKYISQGHKIILSPATEMWDLGTPESLERYLASHKK